MAKKDKDIQNLETIGLLAEEKINTAYDKDKVENIVKKMKRKYKEEGISEEKVTGDLAKLKSAVSGKQEANIRIESPYAIQKSKSQIVRIIGDLYLKIQNPMSKLGNFMGKFPGTNALQFNLYCANLPYTTTQYVGLVATAATAVGILLSLFTIILSGIIGNFLGIVETAVSIIAFNFSSVILVNSLVFCSLKIRSYVLALF